MIVASNRQDLCWLENSGNGLLIDREREAVRTQSYAWMMERVPRSWS